ncbi:CapA family protein [Thioalkalivibrio nitratireducens]|uniref:CapA family protein n=1 Tax=Thioalkalivibrio nitratireducens TaxID=186931 RepID=UPI0012EEA04E|nr:CapA family protein [Thioalkalivibrio nitratireducens]
MSLAQLASAAKPALSRFLEETQYSVPACGWVLFFSACNGHERAHVVNVRGNDFDQAWANGMQRLRQWLKTQKLPPRWLRVDVVSEIRELSWLELKSTFAKTKTNYFKWGVGWDPELRVAVLEQELSGTSSLYTGDIMACTPNQCNLQRLLSRRFGVDRGWPESDSEPMWVFRTRAVFANGRETIALEHEGNMAGVRRVGTLDVELVRELVCRSSDYLSRQVRPDGRWAYGWAPAFNKPLPSYNSLRHASSAYALLEGWELTKDAKHLAAAERALEYLCRELIHDVRLPNGNEVSYLVDVGNEIKLGGNAVSLLALAKHAKLTSDTSRYPLMEKLALGLLAMQDPETGSFVHVLEYPSLELKETTRTIYYDGEAAFGLLRLYDLTGDPRWLEAVHKAMDHFIASEHWRAHDHWLGYCITEFTQHVPEEKYFLFGIQNVREHLDFVLTRLTTYPTLLELMMAAEKMFARMRNDDSLREMLNAELDLEKFERALNYRARYLLNGYFYPELAMFFKVPTKILGAFFIRHYGFRVRIDDVQHYLSGYVAYLRYLKNPGPKRDAVVDVAYGETRLADRQLVISARPLARPPSQHQSATTQSQHITDPRGLAEFKDTIFGDIFASHVVATLPYREFQRGFLSSVYRLLAPGGVLKLSVPDLSVLARLYLNRSLSLREQTSVMRMMFGAQTGTADFNCAGYDFELIKLHLERAGFVNVYQHVGFRQFSDITNKVFLGRNISLNVSGRKPRIPLLGSMRMEGGDVGSTIANPSVLGVGGSDRRKARVIWGGDVNLGRRQHYRTAELGSRAMFERIPELANAELRIVNLECVVASIGEHGVEKGERGPYYYRARPEMVQVLSDAGINVVAVANNHAGDYGSSALMQQQEILARAGIGSVGAGRNREEAFAPIYRAVGDCSVAIFAVDATMPHFAAGASRPGIAYLSLKSSRAWIDEMKPRIGKARDIADVVLVAVHWGRNGEPHPGDDEVQVGHALVDAGADAVLGASAHRLQGVEVYKQRPIIHDAGNLLFDAKTGQVDSGLFRLSLSDRGVEMLEFMPVISDFGLSFPAPGTEARERCLEYARMSWDLGSEMVMATADTGILFLDPLPRNGNGEVARDQSGPPAMNYESAWSGGVEEATCCVDAVPRNVAIAEIPIGPLRLLGVRVLPQRIVGRQMIWVESYWQADHELSDDVRLDIQVRGIPGSASVWGRGMDHDPCDWMMPTRHWRPGRIYRDYFGLRPPPAKQIENGIHRVDVGLVSRRYRVSATTVPGLEVEVIFPGRTEKRAGLDTRPAESQGSKS